MMYYFLYFDNLGRIHRKKFNDVAEAVRWRMLWCSDYAYVCFDNARKKLKQGLDIDVDTKEKAQELYENLISEAMDKCSVLSDKEFQSYVVSMKKQLQQRNEKADVDG